MTREKYNKAKDIIAVLDRIDRVLSTTVIMHNDKTTFEHSFKTNVNTVDLCLLAENDVGKQFLELLYDKKVKLENQLKEL